MKQWWGFIGSTWGGKNTRGSGDYHIFGR